MQKLVFVYLSRRASHLCKPGMTAGGAGMTRREGGVDGQKSPFDERAALAYCSIWLFRWRSVHGGKPRLGLGDLLRGESHALQDVEYVCMSFSTSFCTSFCQAFGTAFC